MMKPSHMMAFDALCELAARGGRGEALFGNTIELARPAFERTLIGNEIPQVYIEFSLSGEPTFDILSAYGSVEEGAQFAPGAGYGYQPMMDWFSHLEGEGTLTSCGIEVDCSTGETERPGSTCSSTSSKDRWYPSLRA